MYGDLIYGEASPYGTDGETFTSTSALRTGHKDCVCGDGWRFEATDLHTGRVKAVLHPISAEWEDPYSRVGTGSLLIATRDPAAADIWPHETGIYISRVNPDGTRKAHFGGLVEKFSGSQGGATTLGLQSIDEYLFHRVMADDDEGLEFETPGYSTPSSPGSGQPQTQIAAGLVNLIHLTPKAIPLFPIADNSNKVRVRHWDLWEFKNIGEAIKELTEVIDGVKYRLEHVFIDGFWSTNIRFVDTLGTVRNYTIKSDREGWQYSLEIDAKDQASRVYAIGADEELAQKLAIAYDADTLLPEFQAAPAFKDVSVQATLEEHARGHVTNFRDPIATPVMTIPGTGFPEPEVLQTGDTINVDIGYGVITFQGQCKVLSQSWKLTDGEPVTRTLALLPVIRPKDSIRNQTPARPPSLTQPIGTQSTTQPWPTPGLVTRVHPNYLHEISGMQLSRKNPGHVWVHNDNEVNEIGDPVGTVYLVSLADGNVKGKYICRGGGQPTPLDTEAIRIAPNGTIWSADIGNNDHTTRGSTPPRIYGVSEPLGGGDKGSLNATVLRLNYPFGQRNAECLLIHPSTGHFYIVSKESGKARVVSFGTNPVDNMTGTLVATISDLENVTDGTFTLDGRFVLFRAYQKDATFVYSATTWKRVGKIPTPPMPKSESITMEGRCSFLVGTEAKPHEPISETETPIYRVLLPTQYGGICGGTASTGSTSGGASSTGGTALVPAQILNLTNFKLTLPV